MASSFTVLYNVGDLLSSSLAMKKSVRLPNSFLGMNVIDFMEFVQVTFPGEEKLKEVETAHEM